MEGGDSSHLYGGPNDPLQLDLSSSSSTSRMSALGSCPDEILLQILAFASAPTLLQLRFSHSSFRLAVLASDDRFWDPLVDNLLIRFVDFQFRLFRGLSPRRQSVEQDIALSIVSTLSEAFSDLTRFLLEHLARYFWRDGDFVRCMDEILDPPSSKAGGIVSPSVEKFLQLMRYLRDPTPILQECCILRPESSAIQFVSNIVSLYAAPRSAEYRRGKAFQIWYEEHGRIPVWRRKPTEEEEGTLEEPPPLPKKPPVGSADCYVKAIVVGERMPGEDRDCGPVKALICHCLCGEDFPRFFPTVFDSHCGTRLFGFRNVGFCLWDTTGQEGFAKLRPLAYGETDVVLLCFSVGSRPQLSNLVEKYVPEIREYVPDVSFVLVGTNSELRDSVVENSSLCVSVEEIHQVGISIGAHFYVEISSRRGSGFRKLTTCAIAAGKASECAKIAGKKKCLVM